jgi:predicted CoA-binding protein
LIPDISVFSGVLRLQSPATQTPVRQDQNRSPAALEGRHPFMKDTELRALLEGATTIAVVGASTDPAKAASKVAAGLINAGYTVVPVHPTATEILGQPAYPTLADVPGPIDIVDVFRPSAETPAIAEQAAAINAGALWLQLGITSPDARQIAHEAGMTYLEDNCLGTTAQRLDTRPQPQTEVHKRSPA